MPFVKLDVGILNSTLWIDREAREVFLTALLMAEPWATNEPVEQLQVSALVYTGWSVPPGAYGFVAAAGPGIIGRAQVPMEEGLAALRRLGEPDQGSRSAEHDGRRLVRIDGGYVVLNYMKYRDYDYTGARRAKAYRERQKVRHGVTVFTSRDDDDKNVTSHGTNGVRVTDSREQRTENRPKKRKALVLSAAEQLAADAFETAWDAYPRRPNDSKAKARTVYLARLREGSDPLVILAGIQRYAAYIAAEQTEPRFIKQAATFFGPGCHWQNDYTIQPHRVPEREESYAELGRRMMAEAAR